MKEIVEPLLKWYQKNKRTLPWREKTDFYHVWISEVMLQQTRIEAVIPYYKRFIHELPTVFDLAKVDDDRLLKLWEGLGYYFQKIWTRHYYFLESESIQQVLFYPYAFQKKK